MALQRTPIVAASALLALGIVGILLLTIHTEEIKEPPEFMVSLVELFMNCACQHFCAVVKCNLTAMDWLSIDCRPVPTGLPHNKMNRACKHVGNVTPIRKIEILSEHNLSNISPVTRNKLFGL